MIRGAIEVVDAERVAGWIYASSETLRNKLVMGFVGQRCVGTGKVELFRKDLLDAKLGDGYCGFDFPVRFLSGEHVGALVIRLQNSDAALLQASSLVIGAQPEIAEDGSVTDLGAVPPGSVTWMQDQGWLEQHEHDFLKAVQSAGAYERGLRAVRRPGETEAVIASPESVARTTLGVYTLALVEVTRTHSAGFADLFADRAAWRKGSVSVLGIWCEEHAHICLAERSHTGPRHVRGRLLAEPPAGGIDYQFGPDRLLFVHRDCSFSAPGQSLPAGIVLFTATPKLKLARPIQRTVPKMVSNIRAA